MREFKLVDGTAKQRIIAYGGIGLVERVEACINAEFYKHYGLENGEMHVGADEGEQQLLNHLNASKDDLRTLLMGAFEFAKTDEGHDYWWGLAYNRVWE